MRKLIVRLADRLSTITTSRWGIAARVAYIPLLIVLALIANVLRVFGNLWNDRQELKQWVLTGESVN